MRNRPYFLFRSTGVAAAPLLCLAFLAPGHALAAANTVTLSDPVPTLLYGAKVTSDVNRLAAGARPVEGVAADGVSRIVVAVSADSAGQQFTFAVYNDQSTPSASTAQNGALAAVGSTNFDHNQLATAAVTTNAGAMAFVIYRAPLDFARPGGGDDALAERAVSIHWTIAGTSQSGTIPLTVLRPPVVLIHGLWSDPATWDDFTPLLGDPRFAIYLANYSTLTVALASASPSLSEPSVSANALGFDFNARYVAPQIESFVNVFKKGHNPASLPVSAVQADIVAHSMGGNVTRTMPIMPGFASATTFKRGNVHKLITIDTPHLGSPLAIDLLLGGNTGPNACVRTLFEFGGLYTLLSIETPDGVSIDGAMGDLRGGTGNADDLSPALQALLSSATEPRLQTRLAPTAFVAAIAGTISPNQLGHLDVCNQNTGAPGCKYYGPIYNNCSKDPIAQAMVSGADWKSDVMRGQDSDALVPWTSEYNGDNPAPVPLTAIHSSSLELLGLGGPGVLQSVAGAPAQVIALLNTWIADSPPFTGLR